MTPHRIALILAVAGLLLLAMGFDALAAIGLIGAAYFTGYGDRQTRHWTRR